MEVIFESSALWRGLENGEATEGEEGEPIDVCTVKAEKSWLFWLAFFFAMTSFGKFCSLNFHTAKKARKTPD